MSNRLSSAMQNDLLNTNVYSGGFIVIITFNNGSTILLSNTGQIVQDNETAQDLFFEDRGLKISGISESIDFKDHKYKISNTTIKVSNLLKDGIRFSNLINPEEQEIINSRVEIYYKTQNANTLSECLKVYHGKAIKCDMDLKNVSISVEDDSVSHSSLSFPKAKQSSSLILNDSYSEATIPMCFGEVDKAPLSPQRLTQEGADIALLPDDIYNKNIVGNMQNLFVLAGKTYLEIPQMAKIYHELMVDTGADEAEDFQKYNNTLQWLSDGGTKFITIPREYLDKGYDLENNLNFLNAQNISAKGFLQIRVTRRPESDPILTSSEVEIDSGDGGIIKYVGDRYNFNNDGALWTFPEQDGITTYEGLVWNFGLGWASKLKHPWAGGNVPGLVDEDGYMDSDYWGGNWKTIQWLCDAERNNEFVTDNGMEFVFTPRRIPTDPYLVRAWKDYLMFTILNSDELFNMNSVFIYINENDIDLEELYPDESQFEPTNSLELTARYFVDYHLWPAGRVGNQEEYFPWNGEWDDGYSLANPREPYSWSWDASVHETVYDYDEGDGVWMSEGASKSLRFMRLWIPTGLSSTGELESYVQINNGRGSSQSVEDLDEDDSTVGISAWRQQYWDNCIGQKVNERGTRVGGLLPSFKCDPILDPDELESEWGAYEASTQSYPHLEDWFNAHWSSGDYTFLTYMMFVTNLFHSFGRPATEADGDHFTYLEGEEGWYAQGNIYPGRWQWPQSWSNYFYNNDRMDNFSLYMEYGGKRGIYTHIDYYHTGVAGDNVEAGSGGLVVAENDIPPIGRLSRVATRIENKLNNETYWGWERNGWDGDIETFHSQQELYTDANEGAEDYSERFRIIFPLKPISGSNIVNGSAESFLVSKIDAEIKLKSTVENGSSDFEIKTGLTGSTDGANELLFKIGYSSTDWSSYFIASTEDSISSSQVDVEYTQDDSDYVAETPNSMVLRDTELTNLTGRTDMVFDIGFRGASGFSSGLAQFNLVFENPYVYQTALINDVEDVKYYGFVQGRVDGSDGKYTGSPNSLMTKPSDILYNILSEEMGYSREEPVGISEARANHSEMNYSFSITKEIDFNKFISKFSKETKLIPKFRASDGLFRFVSKTDMPQGEQGQYDWVLDDNDIIKQQFKKTSVKDIILKCRVLFNYDYGLKTFLSSTDEPGYGVVPENLDEYISYYNIENIDAHYLEIKAEHIRDMATAKHLRNHILEYRKNTYLQMTLELPLKYLFVEAGDVFTYRNTDEDNDPIYRGDFKPYGLDYMNIEMILGQVRSPHWVVHSVIKKQTGVTIKANQFHWLSPDDVVEQSAEYNTDLVSDGIPDIPDADLETETLILGDVNMDGEIDILDIVAMINVVIGNVDATELEVVIIDE